MKVKGMWLRGGVWWYRVMRDGQRHTWSLGTGDLPTAITRSYERLLEIGRRPSDEISRELAFALQSRSSIRDKTRAGQESVAKVFSEWCGEVSAAAITRERAKSWLAQLHASGKSPATLHSYARTMRSLFGTLIREGRLPASHPNPFSHPDLPKLPRSPRRDFVSVAIRDSIIEAATDPDLRMILLLGFHAGLRKMEIIEARPEWIDLSQGVLHVSKTPTFTPKDSDDRTIPMTQELRAHLAERAPAPYLVHPAVEHGRAEYRYDFRLPFTRHMAACGHPGVTAHTMRRTFASLLVNSGVSLYKVSKWLGDDYKIVASAYGHLVAYDSEIDLPGQPSRPTRSSATSSARMS
jgi:integrase